MNDRLRAPNGQFTRPPNVRGFFDPLDPLVELVGTIAPPDGAPPAAPAPEPARRAPFRMR